MQRRKLTDALIKRARKPEAGRALFWDTDPRRLALAIEPSGHKSFKLIYSLGGRVRWFNIGNADDIALKDARVIAHELMAQIAQGQDPQAD